MATEIEKKWLLGYNPALFSSIQSQAIRTTDIEQGYIPNDGLKMPAGMLAFVSQGVSFEIPAVVGENILRDICDENGNFPADLETRYRVKNENGKTERLFTIKGKGRNDGLARGEVEFPIDAELVKIFKELKVTPKVIPIIKTRLNVPAGIQSPLMEIDFYHQPKFDFISIEVEFPSIKEAQSFVLPAWLAELKPIDATAEKAFKNKELAKNPTAANIRYLQLRQAEK